MILKIIGIWFLISLPASIFIGKFLSVGGNPPAPKLQEKNKG